MAKIISLPPTPKPYRTECRTCYAVIEFYRTDGIRRINDQRDGDYWECCCPSCSACITIAAREVKDWR